MLVAGPEIASKPYNPRHALLDARRGRILATDGTVLAQTEGNRRVYPLGDAARADRRLRFGALRHERDRGRL